MIATIVSAIVGVDADLTPATAPATAMWMLVQAFVVFSVTFVGMVWLAKGRPDASF